MIFVSNIFRLSCVDCSGSFFAFLIQVQQTVLTHQISTDDGNVLIHNYVGFMMMTLKLRENHKKQPTRFAKSHYILSNVNEIYYAFFSLTYLPTNHIISEQIPYESKNILYNTYIKHTILIFFLGRNHKKEDNDKM